MTALPDTQERYPSKQEVLKWAFINVKCHDITIDAVDIECRAIATTDQLVALVRKACDWQREQDALLCESAFADPGWNALLRNGALVCADSIRGTPPQPGAAQ